MGKMIIRNGQFPPLTEAQKQEVEEAQRRPINYEDIPPLTDEQLERMQRANAPSTSKMSV